LLEDSLFRRWLGFVSAGFLLLVSLPILAAFWLIDRIGSRGAQLWRRIRGRTNTGNSNPHVSWAENEFQFEHAIEKYQELIDATVRRRK
jgi:hypothetical protein